MPKKCPPGIICFENATLFILFIILCLFVYIILYTHNNKAKTSNTTIIKEGPSPVPHVSVMQPLFNRSDVLHDPYAPPLKNNAYLKNTGRGIAVPINIQTQGPSPDYQQVGILTRNSGRETILPLFGRPSITNRDKWQYYTTNDKHNAVKLPISINGKSCTSEYGCDNIYNGDNVYVEGYNDVFNVTIYENNNLRYLPYIPY